MANGKINLGKQSGGVLSVSFPDGATNTEVVLPESGNLASVDTAVTDNAIARYDGTTGKLQDSSVTIADTGNVGIGTSNPIDKLTMYSASGNLFFRSQSGISTLLTGVYSDGTTCVNSLENYPLILLTNNAERMRIDTAGNVLVTSPAGIGYGAGAGGTVTQLTSKSTTVTLNKPTGQIIMNNEALTTGTRVQFNLLNSLVSSTDAVEITLSLPSSTVPMLIELTWAAANGLVQIGVRNNHGLTLSEALVLNFVIIKGSNY